MRFLHNRRPATRHEVRWGNGRWEGGVDIARGNSSFLNIRTSHPMEPTLTSALEFDTIWSSSFTAAFSLIDIGSWQLFLHCNPREIYMPRYCWQLYVYSRTIYRSQAIIRQSCGSSEFGFYCGPGHSRCLTHVEGHPRDRGNKQRSIGTTYSGRDLFTRHGV